LNANHREGGPKARFFASKGLSDSDWIVLAVAVEEHPVRNPIQDRIATGYGEKIAVRCTMRTPDGSNSCILTVWMEEPGQSPRFVTAYPSKDAG
jgi:hypothetical protein